MKLHAPFVVYAGDRRGHGGGRGQRQRARSGGDDRGGQA